MSEAQHTPGPWSARKAPHGPIDIFDPRGRDVVTVYGGGVECEARGANAALIAAAPDMLAALRLVLGADQMAVDQVGLGAFIVAEAAAMQAVRAAIAKAEGRS